MTMDYTIADYVMDLVLDMEYEYTMEEMRAEEEIQYQQEDDEALEQYDDYWARENYREWFYWKRVEIDRLEEQRNS